MEKKTGEEHKRNKKVEKKEWKKMHLERREWGSGGRRKGRRNRGSRAAQR